jgi:hypothetical protein
MTRRQFLRGAGAAALSALLSACGLGDETSTSTPSHGLSQMPGVPSLTASPTSTGSPTPTATPHRTYLSGIHQSPVDSPLLPTETPVPPTPTPTPPPTPFPAGPPTKLGLFVAWFHPQVMELISTGNVAVLKTLELDPAFLAEVKAVSPDTIVVGRADMDQVNLSGTDMPAEARRIAEAVRPLALDSRRAGLVDAWEGFNEPVPGDEEQMRRLGELEAERVRILARDGLRAVVGNFGTGQPPLEWWPAFRPALEAAHEHGAYLGLHEYSAPTIWHQTSRQPLDFGAAPGDSGWLTLRYRKVYDQYLRPWGLELPLILTECGVDGLVTERPGPEGQGWKDFAAHWAELGMGWDTAGNYIEQVAWYDSQIQLDPYVKGAAIFAMTAFGEWESYQLQGPAASILHQYLSVHPPR